MGSTTVAVRTVTGTEDVLNWVLGDHLGSTSVTANADGSWNSEIKYTAFGEVRASSGLTPTEYRYTNQRYENSLGLYFYVARWYDPYLNHFIQADTLVPGAGNVKAYDRYAYAEWNPIKFNDPTGHWAFAGVEPNREESFHELEDYLEFHTLPVSSEDVEWVQLFGGTKFAKNGGKDWGYDLYCQGYHCGLDLGAAWGSNVFAGVEGRVVGVWSDDNPSEYFGKYRVDIRVGDYRVIIGHMGEINVSIEDYVNANTIIGTVGNPAGDPLAGNDHIHVEVRSPYSDNGWSENKIHNPLNFMGENSVGEVLSIAEEQKSTGNSWTATLVNGLAWDEQPIITRGGTNLWP